VSVCTTMENIKTNREILLQALFENEIKSVVAHFSGSGDSGEINELNVVSIDDEIEVDEDTLTQILLRGVVPAGDENTMQWVDGTYSKRDFDKQPMTLHEWVMLVCYEELSRAHGGWEINAGSYGTISIAVPLGGRESADFKALTIECHEYDEDYESDDEEEYNDE